MNKLTEKVTLCCLLDDIDIRKIFYRADKMYGRSYCISEYDLISSV